MTVRVRTHTVTNVTLGMGDRAVTMSDMTSSNVRRLYCSCSNSIHTCINIPVHQQMYTGIKQIFVCVRVYSNNCYILCYYYSTYMYYCHLIAMCDYGMFIFTGDNHHSPGGATSHGWLTKNCTYLKFEMFTTNRHQQNFQY